MNTLSRCAALGAMALTILGCTVPGSEKVAAAAGVPLVNTNWQLTQLGDQVVNGLAGGNPPSFQLQAENPRITGFAGCNRLFGGYLLNGEELKFDQIGATKMACLDETRMRLEQQYFDMLSRVAGWKITDSTLELSDAGGTRLATFAAATPLQ